MREHDRRLDGVQPTRELASVPPLYFNMEQVIAEQQGWKLQAKLLSLRSTVTSLQFVNQIDHLPDVVLHMRGTLQNHVEANLRIGSYRGVRT